MVGVDEHGRRGAMAADDLHDPAVAHLREAAAAELHGCRHAQDAQLGQSLDHRGRDIGLAVDRGGVDVGVGERLDLGHGLLDRRPLVLGQVGVGEERIAPELAPEQRLGEPAGRGAREEQLLRLADLLGPQRFVVVRRRGTVGCRGRYRHDRCLLPRVRDQIREPRGRSPSLFRNCRPRPVERNPSSPVDVQSFSTGSFFVSAGAGPRLCGSQPKPPSFPTQKAMIVANADHDAV